MRHFTLAGVTLATLTFAVMLSAAHADSYYGPRQVGNQCWKPQSGGVSLGYWEACPAGRTAQAAIRRPAKKPARN
jgi:hypothetical protein